MLAGLYFLSACQGCKATYKYLKLSPRDHRTKLVPAVKGGKARGNRAAAPCWGVGDSGWALGKNFLPAQ